MFLVLYVYFAYSRAMVKKLISFSRSVEHPFHEQSAIEALEDYDRKICEYLPEKFVPLLDELQIAIDCLDKYNQSFYTWCVYLYERTGCMKE